MRVTPEEIDAAAAACDGEQLSPRSSSRATASRPITAASCPSDERFTDALGVELGRRWTRDRGGRALRAGRHRGLSVLGADERGAGQGRRRRARSSWWCRRRDGKLNPLVLAAAKLAGVDEIYRIGGAQAVAALAYGTATIAPVDKIVGPGNAYVAAAKRQVFGQVGIDMIAGPSEVLVVADATANPDWIAADLLAQAEHDAARAVDPDHRRCRARRRGRGRGRGAAHDAAARRDRRRRLARLRRHHRGRRRSPTPCRSSTASRPSICEIAARRRRGAGRARSATPARSSSARYTPEAIGDYVAGSNHVLPTARSARFSSGLGVLDFMKRTSILKCGRGSARARSAPPRSRSARPKGCDAHARSVAIRLNRR